MAFRNCRPVNLNASRNLNKEYTNDTGQAIEVTVGFQHTENGDAYTEMLVDGVVVDRAGGHVTDGTLYYRYTVSTIVPIGAKYIVKSQFTKEFWTETRPV